MPKQLHPFLFLLLLLGCQQQDELEPSTYSGKIQGTYFSISWYGGSNQDSLKLAIDSVFRSADQQFSTYLPNSTITLFNQSDSGITITPDFRQLFLMAIRINSLTKGAFDPSLAPLINAYGFGPEGMESARDSIEILYLKRLTGMNHFSLTDHLLMKDTTGPMLDFNAIAQGFTVDLLSGLFKDQGIESYLIEVGGELKAKGMKPKEEHWKIGIEKPLEDIEKRELAYTLKVKDKAVATSGNYRKYYLKNGTKITHTIDPGSASSVNTNLISATVVADSCAHADALATAFMVMGVEEAIDFLNQHQKYQAILMYLDEKGAVLSYVTEGLQENLEKVD